MLASAVLSLCFAASVLALDFTIVNKCPKEISVFINGQLRTLLKASGGSLVQTLGPTFVGAITSDVNGGNGVTGVGSTKAGFNGLAGYYFIVTDPKNFNTGMSIVPKSPAKDGFCGPAACDEEGCKSAFTGMPSTFPPPGNKPPPAPLNACPGETAGYTITFCPSENFPKPKPQPVEIHPSGKPKKCLDVRAANFANGTPVQIFDCNGTPAQKWLISRGKTAVRLAGTNFCLDAGSFPANALGMKIWQCYDNLPAQEWTYTPNNKISLNNKGLCLDLTNGGSWNWNQMQTWWCTPGNTNQIWTTVP
ncbi:ricin B lectin domain-containing protein [Infundibulicybe gibba]|nr:ricin B lectin domain-containing protein [Infundibulicybe gibba]